MKTANNKQFSRNSNTRAAQTVRDSQVGGLFIYCQLIIIELPRINTVLMFDLHANAINLFYD